MFESTRWEYKPREVARDIEPIAIERCKQRDGSYLYAIRQMGACWSHNREWEYEPIPSSRDDAFFERCRWKSWEEAANAIVNQIRTPNGRLAEMVMANGQ